MLAADLALELHRLGRPNILVVGDGITDHDIHCLPKRFAQEAAHCPVYEIVSQESRFGGACAVVDMVRGLGGIVDAPTILMESKSRILVDGQQIVRVDRKSEASKDIERVPNWIKQALPNASCVLIADYGKGVCTDAVLRAAIHGAKERGIPCIVDPAHNTDWKRYKGANCIKCNQYEQQCVLPSQVSLIVTEGDNGMTLYREGHQGSKVRINTKRTRKVVDVTGAGDMVLAALGVCITGGMEWAEACQVANAAAGLKVERRGAVPVSRAEVILDLLHPQKHVPTELVPRIREAYPNKKIVVANGVFRVPHAGHAWLLKWAKSQGDVLVLAINDDASAQALRHGAYVMPLEERIELLGGLEYVDWIVPFAEPDPCDTLRLLKPDLMVKGHEYSQESIPGSDLCPTVCAPESPYDTHCTSLIAEASR